LFLKLYFCFFRGEKGDGYFSQIIRKSSLEEYVSNKDLASFISTTKVVQNLIVPSSYFEFSKTGLCKVKNSNSISS